MSTDTSIDRKDAAAFDISPAKSLSSSSEKIDSISSDDESGVDPRFKKKSGPRTLFVDGIRINVNPDVPALAESDTETKWSWLDLFRPKKPVADWNAIATRPSVYDDPILAPHYAPKYIHKSYLEQSRPRLMLYMIGQTTRIFIG